MVRGCGFGTTQALHCGFGTTQELRCGGCIQGRGCAEHLVLCAGPAALAHPGKRASSPGLPPPCPYNQITCLPPSPAPNHLDPQRHSPSLRVAKAHARGAAPPPVHLHPHPRSRQNVPAGVGWAPERAVGRGSLQGSHSAPCQASLPADDAMPAAVVRGRAQRPCAWEQPPPDCSLLTVSAPPQRPWRPGRSGSAAAARSGPAAGMSRPAGGSCHAARKRWRAAPCCRVFAGCQRDLRPGSATPHRPRRTCTGASAGGRRSPASSPCAKATPASSEACRRGYGARGKALQLGVGGEPRCQADALVRGMAAPSWQRRLLAGAWLVRARPPHLTRSPLPIWEKRTGSSSSLPPGVGPYQSPLPPPPLLELSSCPGAGPSRRRE